VKGDSIEAFLLKAAAKADQILKIIAKAYAEFNA
jgi:hypothetical protein